MKLFNILLLSSLGCANAQFFIPFFYNLFPRTGSRNPAALQELTNSSDPFTADMAEEVTAGIFDLNSCDNTTVIVTFIVSEIEGLSTYDLDCVDMTSYGIQGSSVFKVSGSLASLEASYSGFVEGDGCDEPSFSNSFSGTASLENPGITYTASGTSGGFFSANGIQTAEITDVSVTYDSVMVNMNTDPPLFLSILDEVKTAIAEGVEDAISSSVDATLISDNLDISN